MSDMHVVQDGDPAAPALLLLTNGAATTAVWDPVIPTLAASHRVIRINPLGQGGGGYDVPSQARRVAAELDRLGVRRVTAVGHSSGSMVATALVEQRPDLVAGLVIIAMSPDLTGLFPEPSTVRLVQTRFPGALLWRLRSERSVRQAVQHAFTRPVPVPAAMVADMLALSHRDLVGVTGAYKTYLRQRSLVDRLAGAVDLPLLVVFGADDKRWRSSSVEGYRVLPGVRIELLPGVGHMVMMEDPGTTGRLLLEFAAAAEHPS